MIDAVTTARPDAGFGAAKRAGASNRRRDATPTVASVHPIR